MKSVGKPAIMPAGYFGWNLIDGEAGIITLKDALHNLSASENGNDHQFGKGVLVGVVSTLIACGMEYEDAIQLAGQCMPTDVPSSRIPAGWEDRFPTKVK